MNAVWRKGFQPARWENGETGSRVNDSRSLTEPPELAGGRLMPTIMPYRPDDLGFPRRKAVA